MWFVDEQRYKVLGYYPDVGRALQASPLLWSELSQRPAEIRWMTRDQWSKSLKPEEAQFIKELYAAFGGQFEKAWKRPAKRRKRKFNRMHGAKGLGDAE